MTGIKQNHRYESFFSSSSPTPSLHRGRKNNKFNHVPYRRKYPMTTLLQRSIFWFQILEELLRALLPALRQPVPVQSFFFKSSRSRMWGGREGWSSFVYYHGLLHHFFSPLAITWLTAAASVICTSAMVNKFSIEMSFYLLGNKQTQQKD